MSAPSGPIAYLTGEYPMVSHTFIQREIAGLRALGLEVVPFSIRRVGPEQLTGPEERAAEAETTYVLAAAKNPLRLLRAHLACLARNPGRYLSALRLALTSGAPGAKALLWQLFYFAEAGVLAEMLRARGVTHLHNHFADSSCTVAMLASALSDVPFSFTMHGPTEFFAAERWRLGLKVARARFVACISHFCRSQMMIFSDPAHWEKLHIVHCGVDLARYRPDAVRGQGDGVEVLFVGRLTELKGVAVLIEAVRRRVEAGGDLRLRLVGDGPARTRLEALAAPLGARMIFSGALGQGEVAEALARADMLVLASFAEGVPVVLMEAMAARLPVIASRVGGVAELVEDGVSGLLVAPSDVDGLATAIARLAANRTLRSTMGTAGRAKVETEFDISHEAAHLASLLSPLGHGCALGDSGTRQK